MTFKWALQCLRHLYNESIPVDSPATVITDRDLDLMDALKVVFPITARQSSSSPRTESGFSLQGAHHIVKSALDSHGDLSQVVHRVELLFFVKAGPV